MQRSFEAPAPNPPQAKTCSCKKWYQFGIPCSHAIAAARATGRLHDMKAWYTHSICMQSFYLVENYAAAYANATVFLPEIEIVEADGATKPAVRVKQAAQAGLG